MNLARIIMLLLIGIPVYFYGMEKQIQEKAWSPPKLCYLSDGVSALLANKEDILAMQKFFVTKKRLQATSCQKIPAANDQVKTETNNSGESSVDEFHILMKYYDQSTD